MKTINLKGKDYAPVSERLRELHENEPGEINILTEPDFNEGWVIMKARIELERGIFTGHAFGKVDKEKALEKLETVAVGRALANAGYLAGGEIASFDEMQNFAEKDDNEMQI